MISSRNARLISVMVAVLVLFSACGAKTPTVKSSSLDSQTNLTYSVFGNVSARLFGLATFEADGQTASYPIEFAVPPITINWMGAIFNGQLEKAGGGQDTTYKVHGSMSTDGKWIESMVFSREILRPVYGWDFFRVTLRNVPLTSTRDENGNERAVSNKVSSDVQRYLMGIEYNVAPSSFVYVSTDLSDTSCIASLDVVLATGPGSDAGNGSGPMVVPPM